jgi:hypothetical protein
MDSRIEVGGWCCLQVCCTGSYVRATFHDSARLLTLLPFITQGPTISCTVSPMTPTDYALDYVNHSEGLLLQLTGLI